MSLTQQMVARAYNSFGPLTQMNRVRLYAVLENPTQETWEDAYSLIISDRFSLWAAWIAVDDNAVIVREPDEPWPRVPDQFTLLRAMKHALRFPRLQKTGE